jgi:hypothetical protein
MRPVPFPPGLQILLRRLLLEERHTQAQPSQRRHLEVLLRPSDLPVQVAEPSKERVEHELLVAALHQRRPGRRGSQLLPLVDA